MPASAFCVRRIFRHLLVETGFISNNGEERLLGSSYQQQIAEAIYNGLRKYFLAHPLQSVPKEENRPLDRAPAVSVASNPATGTVQYPGPAPRRAAARGPRAGAARARRARARRAGRFRRQQRGQPAGAAQSGAR